MTTSTTLAEPLPSHGPIDDAATPAFFPVSLTKLLVLSICTLSLYEIYWFYKNWKLVKHHEQSDILPVARAFFTVLFCYSLFRRVDEESQKLGMRGVSAGLLAAGWIVATVLHRLPDPYWLISFLAVLFLLPVQHAMNQLNATVAPGHDANSRFTGWNIATVIVGGLVAVLVVAGVFIVPEQA